MGIRRLIGDKRHTGFIAVVIAGALLAGCQTNGTVSSSALPDANAVAPPDAQTPAADMTLAFEPVVGIPQDRATTLATELGSGAAEQRLPVIGRDKPGVTFRIKGYFSASTEGQATRVSYIWDIFDAEGTRVHRIEGEETVPAALPDPWSGVPDQNLQSIARATVDGLRKWLDEGAPTTAVAGDPLPPGGLAALEPVSPDSTRAGLTDTRTIATGRAGRIPETATASLRPSSPVQQTARSIPTPPRFTYFLSEVAGATGDGAKALSYSLSSQLEAAGGARVASTGDADFLISGEATIAPPSKGRQVVAIIWFVADKAGKSLGSVRQIAKFSEGSLDKTWGVSAETAAASAAPGVLALMPEE